MRRKLGLDVPIHIQYGRWLSGVLRGDLGQSLWTKLSVTENIINRLPVYLEVGILGIIISSAIAIPVDVLSGMRPETNMDYFLRSIAILYIYIPNFWLATIILVYPSVWWNWSPRLASTRGDSRQCKGVSVCRCGPVATDMADCQYLESILGVCGSLADAETPRNG